VLVDAEPPVFDPPVPPPPAPPALVVEELPGSQVAVWLAPVTHSKPELQPQLTQSPGWH
jgi:hypothetical protein